MEFVQRYAAVRHRYHLWRYELEVWQKVMMALGFACLTGMLAQMRVHLPFTPVPVTGQVFAVLLAGVALGHYWGGASQLLYVLIGLAGVPWFAPRTGAGLFTSGGMRVLYGPTFGYLVGFIIAAFIIGWLVEKRLSVRRIRYLIPVMLLCVGIIYLCGWAWLAQMIGAESAFVLGVLPFIGVDIAKTVAAAGIGDALLTKQPYGPER